MNIKTNEKPKYIGIFTTFDNPGYSTQEIGDWLRRGKRLSAMAGINPGIKNRNLLMASQKLLMAQAVYPTIDKLVITTQTDQPTDSESSYTGAIYTSAVGDEAFRSDPANPYQVIWNIPNQSANGTWGSFILINSAGQMINRALAGVAKTSNQGKIVTFLGSVV